jgi:diaminohydroxyphosphoribosylaminopyrimidine deaminase/5-amino-6-(5-phosphoribosylamino)uracil reductase
MRSEEMGILVGKNTVLVDNPSLTTRNYPGKNPIRIILDNQLELWNSRSDFSVFNKDSKTLIVNSISNFEEENFKGIKLQFNSDFIENLMIKLHQENIQSIIVEGGAVTIDSFIKEGTWDEAFIFENEKKFENGVKAPTLNLEANKTLSIGNDSLSIYKNYEM